MECVARMALWELGLDYNHGTGHGVGAYLNVHEGYFIFINYRKLFDFRASLKLKLTC